MGGSVVWTLPEITGTYRQYAKPPIIEAIIDVEVEFADRLEASTIQSSLGSGSDITPIHELVPGEWEGDTVAAEKTVVGYSFMRSDDGAQTVVRYRVDRFSFSLASPYTTWERFVESAETSWMQYKELFQPTRITAIGLRFVNRIDVGKERFDVSDYLRTGVQISPYLSQIMLSFFGQVQIPMNEKDCFATITTAPDRSPGQTPSTALILDIDVTKRLDLSTSDPAFDRAFQDLLAMIYRRTSEVFEACITDATRNLIS